MKTRKIMAIVLSIVMVFSLCSTAFAAHLTDEVTELEQQNGDLSKFIATQSYVLLENNGVLPLEKVGSVAIFGNGSVATIKGGTGSGAVNNRYNDNVYEAFVAAGWEIANPSFIATQTTSLRAERAITDAELAEATANTDLALYVISRQAGEGSDRTESNYTRSFTLSPEEQANIALLAENFDRFVVIYNTCMMDTDAVRETEGVDAVFFMSNGGYRGSEALVEVLTGEYTPSGKLTDTWALDLDGEYGYPSTDMGFSWVDGNTRTEWYNDGIYVGYRYFDTWGIPVAYEFGYGMSYTDFDIKIVDASVDGEKVSVTVDVVNVGGTYSGKEVVQVYFSAPDGVTEKPYQELAAYGKTDELAPGEKQTLTITFATADMSSYDESTSAYTMDAGQYVIRVGNSSRNTHVAAVATLAETTITEQLSAQVVPVTELEEISKEGQTPITYAEEAAEIAAAPAFVIENLPYENNASEYDDETITTYLFAEDAEDYEITEETTLRTKVVAGIQNNYVEGVGGYSETTYSEKVEIVDALPEGYTKENVKLTDVYDGAITMKQFVASLTVEEMARLTVGPGWGGSGATTAPDGNLIGSSASSVQGGAGQTTTELFYTRYIPSMPNADGPAGIRITQHYWLGDDGVKYTNLRNVPEGVEVIDQYQFCTAFPAGSCYVMSWDTDIIEMEGKAVGAEMLDYGVTTWLAPGLNIHRNPLCGRNFEYYSEDPLVTGIAAAYMTIGVQSIPGIGVTIKHFWGNSQENNRNAVDNVISERAAREIYLKGFEIAVKLGQPQCIMTCYNENNGWPGADAYDSCTDITRGEWGFKGLIMTDWGGGQSTQYISMHAGNDLIMPGGAITVVTNGLEDVEPVWGDDGYVGVTVSQGWWGPTTVEAWNEFTPDANGDVRFEVPVVGGYDAINENVWAYVEDGSAMVHAAQDGSYSVIWTGSYPGNIVLGDLQKSVINILNVVLQSQDMAKLYAGAPFNREIELVPYSEANGALISEGWSMLEKSEIANAAIVADTVTASCGEEAVVNVTYTGDEAITSARIDIDSELPIASIESDYEIENNDGYVIIYAADGSEIDGVLCTLTYDLNVYPWYANGTYAIDVNVVDATNADADVIVLGGVDGAVIIDNNYAAGDANLDGIVSNADVVALARYLVDLVEFNAEQLIAADVDGNGTINNADLIKLARSIVAA